MFFISSLSFQKLRTPCGILVDGSVCIIRLHIFLLSPPIDLPLNQKIQNKIQYDVVAENENRDLYLMFQRVTDVEFVNGVGYVNNNLSGGDRVVRAFAQPESVTGVVIASCQAQSANNRMELHCINIDDGTPYSGSTVGYINLFILVTKGS